MESVYLEAAEYFYLLLQLVKRDETATRVVHVATYTESGPVGYLTLWQSLLAFIVDCELSQCLARPIQSALGCCLNESLVLPHYNMIGLILEYGSIDAAHYLFLYRIGCLGILARVGHLLWHGQQRRLLHSRLGKAA